MPTRPSHRSATRVAVPRPLPTPPPGRAVADTGQATVALVLVVALALVLLGGVTRLGAAAVHRAQARTAADAAALAGVVEQARGGDAGRTAAVEVAARNGATLVGYHAEGTTVEVTVEVDGARAAAKADRLRPGDP